MQPIMRFVRHIFLAVLVIISAVCMAEVGLRIQRLRQELTGQTTGQPESLACPCPISFQHLPFSETTSHWSPEAQATIEITTNSLGLRGREIEIPKPAGQYRIVCIGDEATLAPDVPESETFVGSLAGLLGELGPSVEVINAGQPGHCPLLNLAWARTCLIGLQPDLVILCCDVSDVADDRRCRPLAKLADDGAVLAVKHPATDSESKDLLSAIEREFLLVKLASQRFGQQLNPDSIIDSESEWSDTMEGSSAGQPTVLIEQAWEPLSGMKHLCDQISADFVVAVVPSTKTVRASTSPGTSEVLRLLAERAAQEQIPLLDASQEFARHEDQSHLFFPHSGALTPEGHQLFTHILGNALLDRQTADSTPVAIPVSGETVDEVTATSPLPTLGRRPRDSSSSLGWEN
ncbi:MAG: hypothetical protein KDA86_21495 [Planctomycetaceae bacterium]|nr:hypothetical protein [Planctomycetaceae bacterium]